MKRLFYPDKSFSWLQFPVSLEGLPEERYPHMTIKFFDETEIDSYAIEERLKKFPEIPAGQIEWRPRVWSSPQSHREHYVLAFTKYPKAFDALHNLFDIIKDQYIPWTPHITVPKDYYLLVENQGFTPEDCKLEFGEIELCLGGPNI